VPHNWEDYHGYAEVSHGNLHGTAWYRHAFELPEDFGGDERLYAFFEGVGSYAAVWCNGVRVGEHAGGRTTFTVDLTSALRDGRNVLAVRAHHPEGIDDLPFVCGGCWGSPNTEGSQPLGIFRPVWLQRTGPVRVEPFGVHVLTPELSREAARVEVRTELSNPGAQPREVLVRSSIVGPEGDVLLRDEVRTVLAAEEIETIERSFPPLSRPRLWSPVDPALHRVVTEVLVDDVLSHREETTFGLRWVEWPRIDAPDADRNVRAAANRGRLISTGEAPRTPGNNGLTSVLRREDAASVRLAPMGAVVMAAEEGNRIDVELVFAGEPGAEALIMCEIQNEGGTVFFHQRRERIVFSGDRFSLRWAVPPIHQARQWSPADPYLHRLLVEVRAPDGVLWERSETLFGIRAHDGPLNLARPEFADAEPCAADADVPQEGARERRLLINGEPVFLNGTCEYEHLLGADHAFTDEQVAARVAMIRAAGFNAFRDAHHPHNLRYYDHWDRLGILCWTQMGSRIWFDNPRFRANYRRLVTEWVRERRNHPSVILWGLQNESALPEDFTRELRDLVRELDPTSPTWRLVTTCNGGKGSDWNVPQEWCGTYGGNCHDYDLAKHQLVGEYGVWRSFGVHRETRYRGDENDRSESWACFATETKIRLAEEARDRAIGHFQWIFNSFANPGRSACNHEGPGNARIGSVNYKGLLTAWGQPSDLYHLFRANYADPEAEPMVYIVSHTWPDRWREPAPRTVRIFSNCEEVELFNGVGVRSLGVRSNPGRGRHFEWESVQPATRVLYAVGRRAGREVARDLVLLDHLPEDETLARWIGETSPTAARGEALFRVACGSPLDLVDESGNRWRADQAWSDARDWGWQSWAENHASRVAPDLASCGRSATPPSGASFPDLYLRYRYGRSRLKYRFRVEPGPVRVRLHFSEPWFDGGAGADRTAWRLFDIAIDDRVMERDFDIWARAGGAHRALVWEREVQSAGGVLTVHFPCVRVGQALVCGIEVLRAA